MLRRRRSDGRDREGENICVVRKGSGEYMDRIELVLKASQRDVKDSGMHRLTRPGGE